MILDKPGFRIGENGTRVATQVQKPTDLAGWLGADRAYSNAMAEKYQIPTRALGYRHVFDYREDQLGVQDTFGGAIQVDGAWYCPQMPEALINATKMYRKQTDDPDKIDEQTWRQRIAERVRYELTVKDMYYDGRMRLSSPAERANAAVVCDRKPKSSKSTRLGRTPIKIPVGSDKPLICAQEAVTFPVAAGAKFSQELRHGSIDWQTRYGLMRNTNEGFSGTAKDGAYAGLGQATRRRKRGVAAQSLLCAVLLYAENIRRIDAFLKKAVEDNDGELHTMRKARAKGKGAKEDSVPGQGDAPGTGDDPPDG